MLSKIDINNELSKGINIYPFNAKNIKENSINLSVSNYAWTMSTGDVFIDDEGNLSNINYVRNNNNVKKIHLNKGKSAIRKIGKRKYVVLLPFSTTLIETEEVLAVENYIGGTYHSKVGIVSLGVGHIGTMLGPNFSGHSLIAIHNVSKEPLKIMVGDTFVSVIFSYLNTPIESKNPTKNGHLEKLGEYGIKLTQEDIEYLDEDWKSDVNEVRKIMYKDKKFISYIEDIKRDKKKKRYKYFNKRNFYICMSMIIFFGILYFIAYKLDSSSGNSVWVDRFWTVGFSGIFIAFWTTVTKFIKPSK